MCNIKLVLLFIIFSSLSFAGINPDDVVIQVNGRKISAKEFSERLNGFPQVGIKTVEEAKENLICTLIAEAILSFEAANKELDTAAQYRLLSTEFSNEALYEQWMDSEVRNPVIVSDTELKNAYKRFKQERYVEFWTFSNINDANELRRNIAKNLDPGQQSQLKKIEYGKSLENVEDLIYNLKEGETSTPVYVDSLFYVFKLIKSSPHPTYSKENLIYWMPTIEQIIRDRKEDILLNKKFSVLMKNQEFSIKSDIYKFLLSQLYPMLYNGDQLKAKEPDEIQQTIFNSEVKPDNKFNQPLIIFKNGKQWTLREFWQKLSVCPFLLNYKNPDDLKQGLLEVIRRIIMVETVDNDAKAKKYENKNYVKYQSAMWSNNLLAKGMINSLRNGISVDENEITENYERSKNTIMKPELRRIIPLVVKDKEKANQLSKQLADGADILTLAEKYSQNIVSASKDKPGIFIEKDYWDEVGKEAFKLKVGQTSDVISNHDTSYAIIKLLEIQKSTPYKFEEVKDKISAGLLDEKLQKSVNELLLKSVKNYKITVNREEIKKIEYYQGNMAIMKTHFPLRSLVPMTQVFDHRAKWYKENVLHK